MKNNLIVQRILSKVPGNSLVSDDYDMSLIRQQNNNIDQMIRYKMTGEGQGSQGAYGYWIEEKIENGETIKIPHYFFVEAYVFQTPKPIGKFFQYQSYLIVHELNDNGLLTGKDFVMDAGTSQPFVIMNQLKNRLDTPAYTIEFTGQDFSELFNIVQELIQ